MCTPELLNRLRNKIIENAYTLHEVSVISSNVDGSPARLPEALKQCLRYLQEISETAGHAKLYGVQQICVLTNRNLLELAAAPGETATAYDELDRWPGLLTHYLYSPQNEQTHQHLIQHLQSPRWAWPLSDRQATLLLAQLQQDYEQQLQPALAQETRSNDEEIIKTKQALSAIEMEKSCVLSEREPIKEKEAFVLENEEWTEWDELSEADGISDLVEQALVASSTTSTTEVVSMEAAHAGGEFPANGNVDNEAPIHVQQEEDWDDLSSSGDWESLLFIKEDILEETASAQENMDEEFSLPDDKISANESTAELLLEQVNENVDTVSMDVLFPLHQKEVAALEEIDEFVLSADVDVGEMDAFATIEVDESKEFAALKELEVKEEDDLLIDLADETDARELRKFPEIETQNSTEELSNFPTLEFPQAFEDKLDESLPEQTAPMLTLDALPKQEKIFASIPTSEAKSEAHDDLLVSDLPESRDGLDGMDFCAEELALSDLEPVAVDEMGEEEFPLIELSGDIEDDSFVVEATQENPVVAEDDMPFIGSENSTDDDAWQSAALAKERFDVEDILEELEKSPEEFSLLKQDAPELVLLATEQPPSAELMLNGALELGEDGVEAMAHLPMLEQDMVEMQTETRSSQWADQPAKKMIVQNLDVLVADLAYALQDAEHILLAAESTEDALLYAAEHYIDQLQPLCNESLQQQMAGLEQCCAFLTENILALAAQTAEERQAAAPALTAWPAIMMDYLLAPGDGAQELADYLCNPAWPLPMAETHAIELAALLRTGGISETDATNLPFAREEAVIIALAEVPELPELIEDSADAVLDELNAAPEFITRFEDDTISTPLDQEALDETLLLPAFNEDEVDANVSQALAASEMSGIELGEETLTENISFITENEESVLSEAEQDEFFELDVALALSELAEDEADADANQALASLAVEEETLTADISFSAENEESALFEAEQDKFSELDAASALSELAEGEADADANQALASLAVEEETLTADISFSAENEETILSEEEDEFSELDAASALSELAEDEADADASQALASLAVEEEALTAGISFSAENEETILSEEEDEFYELDAALALSELTEDEADASQALTSLTVEEETLTADIYFSAENEESALFEAEQDEFSELDAALALSELAEDEADTDASQALTSLAEDTSFSAENEESALSEAEQDEFSELDAASALSELAEDEADADANQALTSLTVEEEALTADISFSAENEETILSEEEDEFSELDAALALSELTEDEADASQTLATLAVNEIQEPKFAEETCEEEISFIAEDVEIEEIAFPARVEVDFSEAELPIPAEMPVVWFAPDSMANLQTLLSDATEPLTQALTTMADAPDESEVLLTAVGDCTEAFQPFWTQVEETGFAPLSDLCGFLNENLMAFGMLSLPERQQLYPAMELWPGLLLNYLFDPQGNTEELLAHLQSGAWPMPLQEETLQILAGQLPTLRVLDEDASSAESSPVATDEEMQTRVVSAPFSAATAENMTDLLTLTADVLSGIYDTLAQAENDSEELLSAVDAHAEAMQPVWDAAEQAGLIGVLDICTFANENVMALTMLDPSVRGGSLDGMRSLPGLLVEYFTAPGPGATAIAHLLQSSVWPAPLAEHDADALRVKLLAVAVEEAARAAPFAQAVKINLGDPGTLDLLRATITDSATSLLTALETIVSMDNTNESFLEAIETYTNHVQAIWETAEMAGLAGIQDACSFVNDNLMALSGEELPQRQAAHAQLAAWPDKLLAYLADPAAHAAGVVALLQHPAWTVQLSEEQGQALLAKLLQGAPGAEDMAAQDSAEESEAPEPEEEDQTPLVAAESSEGISLGNAEMLGMLKGELEEIQGDLNELLEPFCTLPNSEAGFPEIAENYADAVGRVSAVMEMMNLVGLQEICAIIINNVQQLATRDQAARAKVKGALERWPKLILAYLDAPKEHVISLLNLFREDYWPARLADEDAHRLLTALTQSVAGPDMGDEEEDKRETLAKPEDVYLAIPEDANQEMLEAYFTEAPQNATELNQVIQRVVQNPSREDVKLAQRIAHTLKGSSNIIGIKGVANLAHHMEDIMEYLYENSVVPPKPLADTLVEAADTLEVMINFLRGQEDPPENAVGVLQGVLDWANRVDRGELNISAEELKKQQEARDAAQQRAAAQPQPAGGKPAAGAAVDVSTEQTLRVPTRTVDDLMRLIGEMSISIGQIQERLKHLIQSTKSLNDQDLLMQQKSFELETLVTVQDISGRKHHRKIGKDEPKQAHEFDSLEFEQYNELHSVTHSFVETIADSRELAGTILNDLNALDTIFVQQERLNKEFQQIIMSTRMEPIRGIASRLERIVRQTCRATDKKAELVVVGGDILMDGEVLTKLTDPLLHILRNSIDHGMELPADRIKLGKPESGTITLRSFRRGNSIVVRCEDDGRGLNYEKIRAISTERGLIKEGQEVTDRELARMIFIPGFSTKSEVTQVSGRGVGMDVVHTSILQLKGTVDIESEPGKGTAIVLTLPMSLVTEHVLLVKCGTQQFAVPTNYLEQALTPDAGEFRKIGGNWSFHMDKNAYPAKTLAALLNIPGDSQTVRDKETRPVVLVREEGKMTAVVVDELLDSRDLVAKNMGKYVTQIKGVAAASILGDGSVVVLLDLPSLLRTPSQSLAFTAAARDTGQASGAFGLPYVLIVDDSLSVRKSLSQLVEDAGCQPLLAKDGLEAIEVVGQNKPRVMLVDMEMPRMNGIELTEHIRANSQTKDIPIFMITSRTTEKHRELAKNAGVSAYLTKPYPEEELVKMIHDALK